ncbi:MAG: hypothetical protein AAGG44_02035, partial [Planctomycetota bacterium]
GGSSFYEEPTLERGGALRLSHAVGVSRRRGLNPIASTCGAGSRAHGFAGSGVGTSPAYFGVFERFAGEIE